MAEAIGSALLAAAVIGSGIMAERLADGNFALALLANTGATVAALALLISLLGPISGAHFNPAVSLVQSLRGVLTLREMCSYVAVQIVGCCAGMLISHAMFELPLLQLINEVARHSGLLSRLPPAAYCSSCSGFVAHEMHRGWSLRGSVRHTGSPPQPHSQTQRSPLHVPYLTLSLVYAPPTHRRSSLLNWRAPSSQYHLPGFSSCRTSHRGGIQLAHESITV